MTVLVAGSTGTVGSEVVQYLAEHGTDVRALSRHPERASFPDGVRPVAGEMTDPEAMRAALDGVSGLFLLNAVTLDELSATLTVLTLARTMGVRDVVYLSVIHADTFTDPPHFAAKGAVERAIADLGVHATILRPGYYMQNDLSQREALASGRYLPPLGNAGVLLVDVRDLGEVGARTLVRRQQAVDAPPTETLDVVSPQVLTASAIAEIWSAALGHEVTYGGDDPTSPQGLGGEMPGWMAYDMSLMMGRFERDGMRAAPGTDERLQEILGRPLRTYDDFAREAARSWSQGREV